MMKKHNDRTTELILIASQGNNTVRSEKIIHNIEIEKYKIQNSSSLQISLDLNRNKLRVLFGYGLFLFQCAEDSKT